MMEGLCRVISDGTNALWPQEDESCGVGVDHKDAEDVKEGEIVTVSRQE